jgi:hypothetical protein
MVLPESVPLYVRELITYCWAQDPMARPSFPNIIEILKQFDESNSEVSPKMHLLSATPPPAAAAVTTSNSPHTTTSSSTYDFMIEKPPSVVDSSSSSSSSNSSVQKGYYGYASDARGVTNASGGAGDSGSSSGSSSGSDGSDVSELTAANVHSDDVSFYRHLQHTSARSPHTLANILTKHQAFLRLIYILLYTHGRSSKSVDLILNTMKTFRQDDHHLTVTYFWIQLVSYHMNRLGINTTTLQTKGNCNHSSSGGFPLSVSFVDFLKNSCGSGGGDASDGDGDGDDNISLSNEYLPCQYYSEPLLQRSKYVFNLPDLQNYPSIIGQHSAVKNC